MKKALSKKQALFNSVISLLLCVSMLIGTTFAWFTDEVSSVGNKIQSGNLKVDLELLDEETGVWRSIKESKGPLFTYENWEPGYTDVTILKVENEGSLALKWLAKFTSENGVSPLADVIDVYVKPSATELAYPEGRAELDGWQKVGTLNKFIDTLSETTYGYLKAGEFAYLGIALHMQETAGNMYQGLTLGEFDIQILATQYTSEADSFDSDYDGDANLMELFPGFDVSNRTSNTKDVTITSEDGKASIAIPAGAVGEQKVTFVISEGELGSYTIDASATDSNAVDVGSTTVQTATYDIKLLDAEGNVLSTTAEKPFTITMYVGTGLHAVPVYHEGVLLSGTTYNAETGYVTFQTTSFSEYQFSNVTFTYSGEYFDYLQDSVTIYNVSELAGLMGKSEYKATYNSDGAMTDSVLTLPAVGNYILYSTVKEYGAYTQLSVVVPEGSRVLLYNVSLAPLNGRDAINIVPSSATNTDARTTYILLADNTNSHLDGRYDPNRPVTGTQYGATMGTSGRSGIGFGGSYGHEYEGELVISGPKAAIYCDGAYNCPGIGGNRWDCGAFDITLENIRFVHAYGGDNGAGVGSSQGVGNSWGNCGDIIVDLGAGNYMDAKSGGNAASVGAGGNGSCDDIYFISGSTGCWVGHYASWTSIGRCTWSSQTGNIYFEGGLVNDCGGGVDAGSSKIYFVAADEAEAKATIWQNWTGPIKSSKDNVIYGYKGKPVSLTITGLQDYYAVGDSLNITVVANCQYGAKTLTADEYTIDGADLSAVGVNTITVTYTSEGESVSVTHIARLIAPVNLTVEPKRSLYNVGELKAEDFKVTVYDSTGVATTLSDFDISVDGNIHAAGHVDVTVSHEGLSATCRILMWNMDKSNHTMYYSVPVLFNVSGWSNHTLGNTYVNLAGQTHTIPGTEEVVSDIIYNNGIKPDSSSPTGYVYTRGNEGNLTVKNASRYTTLGIEYWMGYDAAASAIGYYFDGDMSTLQFTSPAYDIDPTNVYSQFLGTYGFRTNYLTCDLYDFEPGSTHTVHWVAIFNDGIQTFAEWSVTMKAENKDDASYEHDPNKTNVNVIILAGQSNAAGSAPITDEIRAQYGDKQFSNVFINYINQEAVGNTVTTYFTNGNNFDMYKLGIGGFGANYFGPELGLADYLSTNAPGETWYIIKYAPSGSELDRQWFGEAKLADRMIGYVKDKINILAEDYNVKVAGFVWMQGESDAAGLAAGVAGRYSANEQKLMKMVRDEFAVYATRNSTALSTPGSGIVFVNGGISVSGFWPEYTTVNNAKKANCAWWFDPTTGEFKSQATYNIANSIFVDTSTLISKNQSYVGGLDDYGNAQDNNDQAHYSDESMEKLGKWFGQGLYSMIQNCP